MSNSYIHKLPTTIKPYPLLNLHQQIDRSITEENRSMPPIKLKRESFNESLDKKNLSYSYRHQTKVSVVPTSFAKLMIRSASVTGKRETRIIPNRSLVTNPETERETVVEKRIKQEKKFELWKKLTEVKASLLTNWAIESQKMFPSRLNLKKVFDCLMMWNETDSVLTDLMNMIMSTLQSAIYINPKMKDTYKKISPIIDDEDLNSLVDDLDNHVPYYAVLNVITKVLTKHGKLRFQRSKDDIIRIEELEKLGQQMENEINNLKEELDARATPEEHQRVLSQVESLTEQCGKLTEENTTLKNQLREKTNESEALRKQVFESGDQLDALSNKVSDLELERELMQQDINKYQQRIKIARDGLISFKNVKDKLLIKLGAIKNQILTLQKRNEALVSENAKLTVRASIGFENLTPRPNYDQYPSMKELGNETETKDTKNQQKSTMQIVDNLVKRIISSSPQQTDESEKKENQGTGSRKSLKKDSETRRSKSSKNISLSGNLGLKPIVEKHLGSKGNSMRDMRKEGSESSRKLSKTPSRELLTPVMKKIGSMNFEEKVSTRRSNESLRSEFPATTKSQVNYVPSLSKYVVQVDSLKDENITEEDTVHITNELMGYIVQANKAVSQLDEDI